MGNSFTYYFYFLSVFTLFSNVSVYGNNYFHGSSAPATGFGVRNATGQVDSIIQQAHSSGQCKSITKKKTKTDDVPPDFLRGMGYSFVRSLCGRQSTSSNLSFRPSPITNSTVKGLLSSPAGMYSSKDVLTKDTYSVGLAGGASSTNASKTYAILAALAMQESDANISEGEDSSKSSDKKTATEQEAGAYQMSPNSQNLLISGKPEAKEAYKELLSSYLLNLKSAGSDTRKIESICRTSMFTGGGQKNGKVAVDPQALLQKMQQMITGKSAQETKLSNEEFDTFNKSCPAFATEYAALITRTNYNHNGPLARSEVKAPEGCVAMFNSLAKEAESSYICKEIGLTAGPALSPTH